MNNVSTGAESYQWEFGNGKYSSEENPVALFTEDGTYTIKLISLNQFDCSDTTYYQYELLFKGLYVPNAFSPSGASLGERLFQPKGINLIQYHISVFDIWGHLMWESTELDEHGSPKEGWDGTHKGTLMPQGNYMWKISAVFVDNSQWEGSDIGVGTSTKTMGTVTLIR
jgi:large repetitive protein